MINEKLKLHQARYFYCNSCGERWNCSPFLLKFCPHCYGTDMLKFDSEESRLEHIIAINEERVRLAYG